MHANYLIFNYVNLGHVLFVTTTTTLDTSCSEIQWFCQQGEGFCMHVFSSHYYICGCEVRRITEDAAQPDQLEDFFRLPLGDTYVTTRSRLMSDQ